MSDLGDLYQEVILDHNRQPRNFRTMEAPSHEADGYNPLCGDRIHIFLKTENGVIEDVSFQGSGCAISTASASILTETLRGKTVAEAQEVFVAFHDMVTGQGDRLPDLDRLGKLAAFQGVCEFPVRVKCATLCWHTFKAALGDEKGTVSTE